ncbi:MAG: 1-deoxy-D-xylulose-5-phosphate reductoisomerase [Faecalibacillus sp.]
MKKITILGATGSIGQQAIDVIYHHQDEFEIVAMSAGKNINLLEETIKKISVKIVCVIEKNDAEILKEKYPYLTVVYGSDGLDYIATLSEIDIVLNAIVGFAGLLPTIHAIEHHKDIALANKETLVVAGHIITKLVKNYHVHLLPVDSEHSAIFQSLQGNKDNKIKRILLTASGGSFRNKSRDELVGVSVKEALQHPNWSMGAKITIDSATMFNKGLEVIEAKWLFDVDYDQIQVVIHPESILHSAVEYEDTSVIGQMGTPDMRLAIQYALTYPKREVLVNGKSLDLMEIGSLTFKKADFERFKALQLAYFAGKTGGSMPCVLNGANEMANELFRKGKIEFLQIEELVEKAMKAHQVIDNPNIDQLLVIDQWARDFVLKEIGE